MIAGIKRIDEFNDRLVHVIDTDDGQGILFHYNDWWNFAKTLNLSLPQEEELLSEYLLRNGYFSIELPDEEFEPLYERIMRVQQSNLSSRPLFFNCGHFKPEEIPSLREFIEKSREEYNEYIQKR